MGPQSGPTNPRLLPDISAVGDIVFDLSPDGSTQEDGARLNVREVEVALQAAVDPYFRGDIFLGVSDARGSPSSRPTSPRRASPISSRCGSGGS